MEDNPHPGALSQADSDTPRHAAVSKSPVAVVSTSENAQQKCKIVNLEGCENLESVKRYGHQLNLVVVVYYAYHCQGKKLTRTGYHQTDD